MSNDPALECPVYWLGGSSCSGKSSAAAYIAKRYGFTLYRTDDTAFGKFMFGLENAEHYPAITRYRDLLCGGMEAFYEHTLNELRDCFLAYSREVFPLLREDIRLISGTQAVIVEGAHVLPELLPVGEHHNALFLVSSLEQQARIWEMEMTGKIPGGHPGEIENYQKSPNKDRIKEWRTGFHQTLASYIEETALQLSCPLIRVDTGTAQDPVISAILNQLQLR